MICGPMANLAPLSSLTFVVLPSDWNRECDTAMSDAVRCTWCIGRERLAMASECCETLATDLVLCLRERWKEILFRAF